jgi:serine/threonine protein kinase
MAPEVMCRQNHGQAADYYALGVIAYECIMGKRPYNGKSRREIREQILAKQIQIKPGKLPKQFSPEAMDFVNRAIQRKPRYRIGQKGPQEVKAHPWFNGFDWDGLAKKAIKSPFEPFVRHHPSPLGDGICAGHAQALQEGRVEGQSREDAGERGAAAQPESTAAVQRLRVRRIPDDLKC